MREKGRESRGEDIYIIPITTMQGLGEELDTTQKADRLKIKNIDMSVYAYIYNRI